MKCRDGVLRHFASLCVVDFLLFYPQVNGFRNNLDRRCSLRTGDDDVSFFTVLRFWLFPVIVRLKIQHDVTIQFVRLCH